MTQGYMRADLALEQIQKLREEVRLLRLVLRLTQPTVSGPWVHFDSGHVEVGDDAAAAVLRALEER